MIDDTPWEGKFAGLSKNTRLRPADRTGTYEYIDEDAIHFSECDERGRCPYDVWAATIKQVVELIVCDPQPSHMEGVAMKYSKQMRRKYIFTGDPEQRIKIPVVHRMAMHQHDNEGRLSGGLAPGAYRVDVGPPQMTDLCRKNLAEAGLTPSSLPWAPPPVARTVAERIGPLTAEQLDEIAMAQVST